jgi:hypothetical protein
VGKLNRGSLRLGGGAQHEANVYGRVSRGTVLVRNLIREETRRRGERTKGIQKGVDIVARLLRPATVKGLHFCKAFKCGFG